MEEAKSGHPGAPMAQAPLAYRLWTRHMRHDPSDPTWPGRDRFVLSCGHASALLYSMLHLSGYPLPMEELRRFRQLGSKTPGHPEYHLTPGVETTTGPLGQGVGNAVGMAIAERYLASFFNREGFPVVDSATWVIASDGDLMEGVAAEASSLAGHLGLGKLNMFYDANRISIDGSTDLAFTEDVVKRYEAYGWHTLEIDDVGDLEAIDRAVAAARTETARPTLVLVRTHIGYGSPNKQDTASAHGSPLGADERRATKDNLGWPQEPTFHVPEEARGAFAQARERGRQAHAEWKDLFERYRGDHPELAATFESWGRGELPEGWDTELPSFSPGDGPIATRSVSGKVLHAVADHLPQLLGGSADLAPSNNTFVKGRPVHTGDCPGGSNFHFGVREHGMGAALNGMALSGMLRPYGGTFLIFADYMRPSIRLAALMGQPVIYIFTHDSIFLGEDGPTHQPISQLLGLRSFPGLSVLRPADANETVAAWKVALEHTAGPTALVLTRQKLPVLEADGERALDGVARGAYVVADAADPQVLLLATGSEVALALEAHTHLAEKGVATRVVSMPSWDRFEAQDAEYRESVLPSAIRRRLALEAGTTHGWHRYVGLDGDVMGIDTFGASAPAGDLLGHFGFTVEEAVKRVEALLGG
ncbi:MAG: transketolase [Holophagales bacterium]|nr:transketolase [Holophagales bacterium]